LCTLLFLSHYHEQQVADGAAVLAGFGYEGKDPTSGKNKWDGVNNIDIIAFETAEVSCYS
jgi:hypothetical protein